MVRDMTMYMQRIIAIFSILSRFNAERIADFGCGDGKLVDYLQDNKYFQQIICVDISTKKINKINQKHLTNNNIVCVNQSFFEYNKLFKNLDAIILSEVIEHLNMEDVFFLLDLILSYYKPKLLIITTPNRSYNKQFEILYNGIKWDYWVSYLIALVASVI